MTISSLQSGDFVEAKEAVGAALLQRLHTELSGTGPKGSWVCGEKPSRRFTTGFLMPMHTSTGEENPMDTTNISTHGMDFQVERNAADTIQVSAEYSVYIRVLPEWADLTDTHNDMMPRFMLNKEIKKTINDLVRERLPSAIERLREGASGSMQLGDWKKTREEVFRDVCKELGVPHVNNADDDEEEQEENGGGYLVEGLDIPPGMVRPAPMPMKWRRFSSRRATAAILVGGSNDDYEVIADTLSEELRASIREQVAAWLTTSEGAAQAYRDATVMPTDVTGSESWALALERIRATPASIDRLIPPGLPDFRISVRKQADFAMDGIDNIRITLENKADELNAVSYKKFDQSMFQLVLQVVLPQSSHHRLRLNRIKPSYRFRDFFNYAALGVNCGVEETRENGFTVLTTTTMPKYQQPKTSARKIAGLESEFGILAEDGCSLAHLEGIITAYRDWVDRQRSVNPAAHLNDSAQKQAERVAFDLDLAAYNKEIAAISAGIDLLSDSRKRYLADPASPGGVPYRAWLLLNSTMARAWGTGGSWRLFQLTFILSHVPGQASRCSGYEAYHDHHRDEETATLLYFPTGGGKSEAFYGLLVYSLFLDRLRGKHTGVSALIRYPLRLLTIQQAQRLFRLLAQAELVKRDSKIAGDPFAIGFWVGSSNTPNSNSHKDLAPIKRELGKPEPKDGDDDYKEYRMANRTFNKIPICPYCQGDTGMRRGSDSRKRVAIVCTDPACEWNAKYDGGPLPFLITDEDIYGYAPPVILGTIDKLALIGQYDGTINKIAGMFGMARYRDSSGRLLMPRKKTDIEYALANTTPVAPACTGGAEIFHDPFPSLIIQDEAHLLEESLGSFASLFETALDQLFTGLAPLLGKRVARCGDGSLRLPKVIAATATISSPERQIETLYQRRACRFPYPGTSLYESFYTVPAPPPSEARGLLIPPDDPHRPELVSPIMRTYASLMTNGRVSAVATAITMATYHTIITKWWRMAQRGDTTLNEEIRASLPESPLQPFWSDALTALTPDELHSIIDLFRVTLAYVNSKRGGDQVLDSIRDATAKSHTQMGEAFRYIKTELISGGVDVAGIEKVMRLAAKQSTDGDIGDSLREIVATSAISHGVDLDMFNAMFFIGAPSDIAEYIQASSRVGRTHSGFCLLLPIPHSRRDRYIVEVHDIFHRFLEQMVSPAAIERWADNAIARVIPSIFQLWLNGVKEQEIFSTVTDKSAFRAITSVADVQTMQRSMGNRFLQELTSFAMDAIAVKGRGGEAIGRPGTMDYYVNKLHRLLRDIDIEITSVPALLGSLKDYWESSRTQKKPMTSLRDVDEAGLIVPSIYLPGAGTKRPRHEDAMSFSTRVVRAQPSGSSDFDYEGIDDDN